MRSGNLAPGTIRMLPSGPIAIVLLALLNACSGVNTRTAEGDPIRMSKAEFAEYAEATFRYHNRIVNELITVFSLSEEEIPFAPALIRAEEDMDESCRPLNEMVVATIEGRELSLWKKLLLLNQVPECAAATRRVEREIPAAF